jgi:hypothetical protein
MFRDPALASIPVNIFAIDPVPGSTNVTVEIMPGAHSTVAKEDASAPEAAQMVYDMAKRFLRFLQQFPTQFTNTTLLSASDLINRYARVQMDFQKYHAMAKPDPNWLKRQVGVSAIRTIKSDSGQVIGRTPKRSVRARRAPGGRGTRWP